MDDINDCPHLVVGVVYSHILVMVTLARGLTGLPCGCYKGLFISCGKGGVFPNLGDGNPGQRLYWPALWMIERIVHNL